MARAKQLNRCAEFLTLFTTNTNVCTHCRTRRVYWDPRREWTKIKHSESQTETKNCKNHESQAELEQAQTIMNNQKLQINELNDKLAILESKLEHYVSANDSLNSQLQNTTEEKEHALLKIDSLQLVYHERDVELVDARAAVEKHQEEVGQKELQLEQYKISIAQPSKVMPVIRSRDATCVDELQNKEYEAFMPNTLHRPCSTQVASNHSEHISELNYMKTLLKDLQADQQKIAKIVSHLYYGNRIYTQDTTNSIKNNPSFSINPYMGILDTGQNFYNYNRFNLFQPFSQLKAM